MGHLSIFFSFCFYALGVVTGIYLVKPSFYPLYVILVLLPFLFIVKAHRKLLVFLLVFLLGLSLTSLRFLSYLSPSSFFHVTGKEIQLVGRIVSIPKETLRGSSFLLQPEIIKDGKDQRPVSYGLLMVYANERDFTYHDNLELKGMVETPNHMINPGGFSYGQYLYRQGIAGTFFQGEKNRLERIAEGSLSFFYLVQRVKEWIGRRINKTFSSPYSSMLRALLLGERELLPSTINNLFRETGLGHLLAVSGLHVGILSLIWWRLLGFLPLKEKVQGILFIGMVLFYMFICGLQASIVRASLLVVCYSISRILNRKIHILDLLGFSAFLLLLRNPFTLLEVGFQLSYLVYLSILFISPLLASLPTRYLPEKIGLSINLSLAAQLGAWPVMAYYFHEFSLWPLLANLVAIPLLSLILTLIIPALLISLFSFWLYQGISLLIEFLLKIFLFFLQSLSLAPGMMVRSGQAGLTFLLFYFFLLALLLFFLWKKKKGSSLSQKERRVVFICILLLLIHVFFLFQEGDTGLLKTYILDVGSGLAIFFILPGGETLFYDGGGIYSFYRPDYNKVAKEVIDPLLLYRGLRRVHGILFSHYHADHVLGLLPLIQAGKVSFMGGPHRGEDLLLNDLFLQVQEYTIDKEIPFFFLQEGDHLIFGEVLFRVLGPPEGLLLYTGSDENNNSLFIRVEYGQVRLLLTGDMEKEMEEYILGRRDLVPYLPSQILVVGHHGSNTSSTSPFLEAIRPQISIISSSPHRFDHPSPEVLRRLEEVGSAIFRTDTSSAVVVKTDGDSISVYPYWQDSSNFRWLKSAEERK